MIIVGKGNWQRESGGGLSAIRWGEIFRTYRLFEGIEFLSHCDEIYAVS